MPPGILILDNNCYARLAETSKLARLRANARIADLVPQPSELNLIESTSAPDGVRGTLLRAMRDVMGSQPLLPWPFKLLQSIGQGLVDGHASGRIEASGKEWYLDDLEAAGELQAEVRAFQVNIESAYASLHGSTRQKLYRKLRISGEREDFGSARPFLERVWYASELRKEFARATWGALALPGDAPINTLERTEAWRLLLDGEGVAVYERAVAHEQPRVVQRLDLIQLVYLALAPRRVIATADGGLLRAAEAILPGKYPNARAVHIDTLVV